MQTYEFGQFLLAFDIDAVSSPTEIISDMTVLLLWIIADPPWHIDAVGGITSSKPTQANENLDVLHLASYLAKT
ncbi:hypothetical protein AB2B41_12645 [Marimonas sp. MJW-29]|uniref:Uncharacterized protein n=1 Tax=Sulfitobacter sediminis TaxID=3234186 RepID=A0ABV3RNA9_9RHOB